MSGLVFETPQVKLFNGHVVDVLRSLPPESIDCVVTSPPYYGLRDYGTEHQVWGGDPDCQHECDRVESHHVRSEVVHGKSRTTDRFYGGDESRKFNGNHQSHFVACYCQKCGAWLGEYGQEPTLREYVDHTVEIFEEIRRVLKREGTCWLNLGDGYANNGRSGLKPKDLMMVPHRVAIALQDRGWQVRSDIVWEKPNCMPESVRDRPTRSHEYIFLLTKSEKYFYNADAVKEPDAGKSGLAVDFRRSTKEALVPGRHSKQHRIERKSTFATGSRNKRSVWSIATRPYPEAHFAVFPSELPELCIKAGCPDGSVVLDPFAGSGTVLEVAKELGIVP